jgi:lipoyl(octanoyl) transferase
MSSEVETARGITHRNTSGLESLASRTSSAALQPRLRFAPLGMTEQLFARLEIYYDVATPPAAMNMAIDEALLETAVVPTIRFYRWRSPALSFGYFGKFSDVAIYAAERDLVRRWTGGGIVFHGDDLTYSIVIPASNPVFGESSTMIYERIHRALCAALASSGQDTQLASVAALCERRKSRKGDLQIAQRRTGDRRSLETAICDRGYNCFANPVHADVMVDGRKIAGAAQRRTRRGLLQQGSIQGFTMRTDLAQEFAQALSPNCSEFEVNEEIYRRARELTQQKYGTESWLRKR